MHPEVDLGFSPAVSLGIFGNGGHQGGVQSVRQIRCSIPFSRLVASAKHMTLCKITGRTCLADPRPSSPPDWLIAVELPHESGASTELEGN